ncbi:GH1 family beta-glucosidase [Pseudonocardia sp.]|uniref:GH1 family beta-glucosidase n=1 Tax=Pseudonocardia sp. TaxID=60912 RepID=UPI00262F2542|nr:GH1 family beta-glucosidase [Pseudonocardia sp.]
MNDRLLIGTATAAYQVEGAGGGRAPSIWDTFAARPGAILDGSDGSVACDSYHRLDEDLDLLAGLGVDAYRFSLSWPRVQPTGRGSADPAGLDYYSRLVDGLLDRGIAPMPTLYHWDLPQPLQDAGGWPVRDTALRFADYAQAAHSALGDRVTRWATLNEPWCAAFLGHGSGVHAPGIRDATAAFRAAHHLLLAHALGARAMPGADTGVVCNLYPVLPESPEFAAAARTVDEIQNGLWLDALFAGRYPEAVPRDDAHAADLPLIRGSAAWLGVNYYTPLRVGPALPDGRSVPDQRAYPGAGDFGLHPRGPLTTMAWEVDATGLEQVLLRVAAIAPDVPLYVTENGAAYPDARRLPDGSVDDQDRIAYLRSHLAAAERARAAGAPVRGYLVWSLLDNFEWAYGYTQTFGIVEVDPATRDRRPKASYRWLAAEIAARR